MRQRLTSLQEMHINEVKQTIGCTLFLQPEQIARLRYPDDFPSTNRARLSSELTRKGQLALHDLVSVMRYLPETYIAKLLTSQEFGDFILRMMQNTPAVDKKRPDSKLAFTEGAETGMEGKEAQGTYAFRIATFMLNTALAEVIKAMPEAFQESLKLQIHPFLTTVNAIASFTQSTRKKNRSPSLYLPFDIRPSFPSGNSKSTS